MKICKKIPLYNCDKFKYQNILFYKSQFFLLNEMTEKVDVYNLCFEYIEAIETCYIYIIAIKGNNKNLFLIRKNDNKYIYIANKCFEEFDKIELKVPREYMGDIVSIAYNDCDKKIFIATKRTVYSVTINGDFIKEELSNETKKKISTQKEISREFDPCCTSKKTVMIPNITSIGFFCKDFYIAYTKNEGAYISKINSSGDIIKEKYVDNNIEVNTIFDFFGTMNLFVTKKNSYNYIYITCEVCKSCCDDKKKKPKCIPCPKPKPCSCDEAKCEIIRSIANIEASLSHILNAEGEKIQKIVKHTKDPDKILEINESVSNTIKNISLLEFLLINKLELTLGDKKKKDCK